MARHSRQTHTLSRWYTTGGFIALAVLVGAISLSGPGPMAANGSDLSVADECQAALGYANRSSADIQWLQQCVSALAPPTPDATDTPTAAASSTAPTTAPPSSPPPSAGGCLDQPSVCGFPDATNTGVPAGIALTPHEGDLQVTQAGAVISGIDLTGCITIWAADVTIENSRIRCAGPYGIFSYARDYTGGGLQVTDVEIDCMETPTTGIASYGFTATRVNVHGCVNGFAVDSADVIQDSYVHDMFTASSADHSDGLQIPGGETIVRHNTIVNASPAGTSAIIMAQTGVADLTVTDNLLSGGGFTLYCPRVSGTNVAVSDNRFGSYGYAPSIGCSVGAHLAQWSGNVFDSTGEPVPAS